VDTHIVFGNILSAKVSQFTGGDRFESPRDSGEVGVGGR
jgi:hypothetical protein